MFPALTCARPIEGLGTRLAIGHVHVSMGTRTNHCVRCDGMHGGEKENTGSVREEEGELLGCAQALQVCGSIVQTLNP